MASGGFSGRQEGTVRSAESKPSGGPGLHNRGLSQNERKRKKDETSENQNPTQVTQGGLNLFPTPSKAPTQLPGVGGTRAPTHSVVQGSSRTTTANDKGTKMTEPPERPREGPCALRHRPGSQRQRRPSAGSRWCPDHARRTGAEGCSRCAACVTRRHPKTTNARETASQGLAAHGHSGREVSRDRLTLSLYLPQNVSGVSCMCVLLMSSKR